MIRNIEAHESPRCNKKGGEKKGYPQIKPWAKNWKMPPEKRKRNNNNNNNNTNNMMYKLETCSETFKLVKVLNARKKTMKKQ